MRVHLFSDLHLEFEDFDPPGGDILILAGDICTAKHLKANGKLHERYMTFFNKCAERYYTVFYTPGNHESYGGNVSNTVQILGDILPRGIQVGDRVIYLFKVQGIQWRFLLTTLWTNCNNGDPATYATLNNRMNDFRTIRYGDAYTRFTPQLCHKLFNENVAWLNAELIDARNQGDQVFVVTHHGPSYKSTPPKYAYEREIIGSYVSDLHQLMERYSCLKYWAHGHVHTSFNYEVCGTRVITNPKGYYNENLDFDPNFALDI